MAIYMVEEFRRGNIIEVVFSQGAKVVGIISAITEDCKIKIRDYNSEFNTTKLNYIPLTEEWLAKLGFEKIENPNNTGTFLWTINEIGFIQSDKFYCASIDSLIEIQYVHQLQNLYFALTGEELTLK